MERRMVAKVALVSAVSVVLTLVVIVGIAWAANILTVERNGVVVMSISDAGLVGIGEENPTHLMELKNGGIYVKRDTFSTLELETAGSGVYPNITGMRAQGSVAIPQSVQTNDVLLAIGGRGYYSGASSGYSGSRSRILSIASEAWTDIAQGAHMSFLTTPIGTTTIGERVRITDTGSVGIGTSTPDEKFEVEFVSGGTDIELGRGATDQDVTFITLRSPNGTKYYLYPNDAGALVLTTTKP